ncbi:MAG: XRE family transcriptional regulator [Pseudomonadales bacterium]|nr:XRE family transcriptional regulator [Pseudomonadales bacterium]
MKYESLELAGLAERLTAARKATGLTQEEAATHLEMSRPTFIAMEKGTRRPKQGELLKLAALYKVPLNNLLRNASRPQPLTPHLRAGLDMSASDQPELRSAIELLSAYIDDYSFLESLVESQAVTSFPPRLRSAPSPVERFAEHCAHEERSRLNLGLYQPVCTPRKILEEVGVHVFMEKLDSNLSGLYVFVPDFGYCILINRVHPQERRNWTIAHEYGHFLLDRDKPGVDYVKPMQRKPHSERFADAFAAAFLMPETGVQRRFYNEIERSGDFKVADLCRMADYFAVSMQAMALRLESLGLIPRGSWDAINEARVPMKDLKQEAGVEPASNHDSLEPYPQRYKLLAVEAFENALITEGQLARLLRCSRIQAREIVEQCSKTPSDNDDATSVTFSLSRSLLAGAAG